MLTIDLAKELLDDLGFSQKNVTDITAICIMALYDEKPRQKLIKDYTKLSQGARIRDILDYARTDLNRNYAENTRETVRKHSLKYLVDAGFVIQNADDPTRVTNSGLNNYILTPAFRELIDLYLTNIDKYKQVKQTFVDETVLIQRELIAEQASKYSVNINHASLKNEILLSPGEHNVIEKHIVEEIIPLSFPDYKVVYVGDTKVKDRYYNQTLSETIKLDFDIHDKIPDVIGYDEKSNTVILFESVASSGPIDELRKKELQAIFNNWKGNIYYSTAFLYQKTYQKYSTQIAEDTSAYIIESKQKIKYEKY